MSAHTAGYRGTYVTIDGRYVGNFSRTHCIYYYDVKSTLRHTHHINETYKHFAEDGK